jgi:hypothetical protein
MTIDEIIGDAVHKAARAIREACSQAGSRLPSVITIHDCGGEPGIHFYADCRSGAESTHFYRAELSAGPKLD